MRCVLVITLGFVFTCCLQADKVSEIYPGKLLRTELVSVQNNPFTQVRFEGLVDGRLVLKFKRMDRQIIKEKPIYEKVKIISEESDINDRGIRRPVLNEVIEGTVKERIEIIDSGPISREKFQFFNDEASTDEQGILIDEGQTILKEFENLKILSTKIQFYNRNFGICILELTRSEIYEKFGIDYSQTYSSHPKNLLIRAEWDRDHYQPGDTARLSVITKNTGDSGGIYRILARSVSRWSWLDGKMYYIGNLEPGEAKTLVRLITVPDDIEPERYYLRIGFNEYSGAKPQIPVSIVISKRQ